MPTFNPRFFSEPDRLKTIKPGRLITFLGAFAPYLSARGFHFPSGPDESLDYQRLATILMHPDDHAPRAMVDALYYVHEMSDDDAFDHLVGLAKENGVSLDPDVSAGDVAVELWLKAPDVLQSAHAEASASRQKSFTYFSGMTGRARSFPHLPAARIKDLENDLDDWFDEHKRGTGSRVYVFDRGGKVWIAIRHGQAFRREGSVRNGKSATEYYRPEKHDVLIYDIELDNIGVHAATKGETNLYLDRIGRYFFGDPDYFPSEARFTLDPLFYDGAASLNCEDVPGLERVRLIEYLRVRDGELKERESYKATDVFEAFNARGRTFDTDGRLVKGVFAVSFPGVKKPRTVTIRPSNIASFERDADSELVESWLRKRGFILSGADEADAHSAPVLAVA